MYKTNRHTFEELRINICNEISTISEQKHQKGNNNDFRSCTDCIPSGGQNCSIGCSTGKHLLDFLKFITTTKLSPAPFTNC